MRCFMSNPCGYPHCMEVDCCSCRHFKPMFLGIRVPKMIGKLLYRLESFLRRCTFQNHF